VKIEFVIGDTNDKKNSNLKKSNGNATPQENQNANENTNLEPQDEEALKINLAKAVAAVSKGHKSSKSVISKHEDSGLNPAFNFSNYVTGRANQLARAAAIQVAENPGSAYNPLFIYGGVGLGKTHLLQAIGNELKLHNPNAKIRYLHAERYVSDVVKAYEHKAFDEFKRQYHSLDLLLIDDIQFLLKKHVLKKSSFMHLIH